MCRYTTVVVTLPPGTRFCHPPFIHSADVTTLCHSRCEKLCRETQWRAQWGGFSKVKVENCHFDLINKTAGLQQPSNFISRMKKHFKDVHCTIGCMRKKTWLYIITGPINRQNEWKGCTYMNMVISWKQSWGTKVIAEHRNFCKC
jgi:hypothetical protein